MPWLPIWADAVTLLWAPTSGQVVTGLAVTVVGLLAVLIATALAASVTPRRAGRPAVGMPSARTGTRPLPRLIDPDAAGRPRPRAPGVVPAA